MHNLSRPPRMLLYSRHCICAAVFHSLRTHGLLFIVKSLYSLSHSVYTIPTFDPAAPHSRRPIPAIHCQSCVASTCCTRCTLVARLGGPCTEARLGSMRGERVSRMCNARTCDVRARARMRCTHRHRPDTACNAQLEGHKNNGGDEAHLPVAMLWLPRGSCGGVGRRRRSGECS